MTTTPPTTNCSSCGAPIHWISLRNRKGGTKPHPIDVDCERRIVVDEPELPGVFTGRIERAYVSHFATCPDADRHRRSER